MMPVGGKNDGLDWIGVGFSLGEVITRARVVRLGPVNAERANTA